MQALMLRRATWTMAAPDSPWGSAPTGGYECPMDHLDATIHVKEVVASPFEDHMNRLWSGRWVPPLEHFPGLVVRREAATCLASRGCRGTPSRSRVHRAVATRGSRSAAAAAPAPCRRASTRPSPLP